MNEENAAGACCNDFHNWTRYVDIIMIKQIAKGLYIEMKTQNAGVWFIFEYCPFCGHSLRKETVETGGTR